MQHSQAGFAPRLHQASLQKPCEQDESGVRHEAPSTLPLGYKLHSARHVLVQISPPEEAHGRVSKELQRK